MSECKTLKHARPCGTVVEAVFHLHHITLHGGRAMSFFFFIMSRAGFEPASLACGGEVTARFLLQFGYLLR